MERDGFAALCLVCACGGTTGRPPLASAGEDLVDAADASAEAGDPAPDDDAGPPPPDAWTLPCDGDWIVPDATGFVAASTNASQITGRWFLRRDCDDFALLDAGTPVPGTNCSLVSAPVPGMPFVPEPGTSRMCTSGSTVHVLSDDQLTTQWGAYIALDLNGAGAGAGNFNAAAAGLRGFCFYLSGTAPVYRVRFPSDQPIAGNDWFQETLQHEGWHRVVFQDLKQVQPSGTAFDATKIVSIEFEIPASRYEAIPWDFCVDALVAIR